MKKMMMPAVSLAALAAATAMPSAVVGTPRMEAAGGVEALLKQVHQELNRVGDDVRRAGEDALKQQAKTGEVTAEAKETADKALKQYHELNSAVSNLTGKLEALESRNVDLEQHYAGQGRGGAGVVSVGQEIANSDDLKNYIERGAQGGLTLRPTNAITTVSGATGGLIVPDQDRQVTSMPMQRLAVRALLSQATTESDLANTRAKRFARLARLQRPRAAPCPSWWSNGRQKKRPCARLPRLCMPRMKRSRMPDSCKR